MCGVCVCVKREGEGERERERERERGRERERKREREMELNRANSLAYANTCIPTYWMTSCRVIFQPVVHARHYLIHVKFQQSMREYTLGIT